MKTKAFLPFLVIALAAANATTAQETAKENPFTFGASYTGDVINNLSGGIKTGSAYLGMATMALGLDTHKAGLWKGGEFFVFGANTHGDTPSATLIGDLQTASNIEAGNHTYLQEVWYKHKIGRFEITAGLQDLAIEFGNVDYGGLYLNSAFGVKSSISHNVPAPIFPLTNLGLTLKWDVCEKFSWLAAAYDGNPTDFDSNPYNVEWEFKGGDGYLAITELQYRTAIGGKAGTYKLGGLYHRMKEDNDLSHIGSLYANANQTLWESGESSFGAFLQLGYSPSDASVCKYYLGGGVNYTGLFSKKGRDEFGLAFAHEHYRHDIKDETAIEMTWKYTLSDNFFVQPDLQYIINPAGAPDLNNSFSANVRVGLSF